MCVCCVCVCVFCVAVGVFVRVLYVYVCVGVYVCVCVSLCGYVSMVSGPSVPATAPQVSFRHWWFCARTSSAAPWSLLLNEQMIATKMALKLLEAGVFLAVRSKLNFLQSIG